jgi:uncharacterized protein DUF4349
MKAFTLFLIAALTLSACGDESSSKGDGRSAATDMAAAPAPGPPVQTGFGMVGSAAGNQSTAEVSASSGRREIAPESPTSTADPLQNINIGTSAPAMVIRTGQAFIEVEKVDPAVLKIRQLAVQFGGYIANSSMSGGRDQIRQATFELKIPAARYDGAVESLSTIGKVETVSSNAQDVGEEFVDVTARVSNARRLEERLISLLANRTGKLDEVLRVERELARVREEIERYEGRLRFLTTRVATSTLTITVHEPAPILGNNPGENPIAAALRRAWRNFVALLAGTIASLGVLIPLALVGYAGWYGYKRWRSR